MKGNCSCHLPNNVYRKRYSEIFKEGESTITCAGCGILIVIDERSPEPLCSVCTKQLDDQNNSWEGDD